jgi:hypothetical protein
MADKNEWDQLNQAYDTAKGMFVDADYDGLDNYTENKIGTNPFETDTDKDGLSDGLEVQHGLDPLDNLPDPVEAPSKTSMQLPDASNNYTTPDPIPEPAPVAEMPQFTDDQIYNTNYNTDSYTSDTSTPDYGYTSDTSGDFSSDSGAE